MGMRHPVKIFSYHIFQFSNLQETFARRITANGSLLILAFRVKDWIMNHWSFMGSYRLPVLDSNESFLSWPLSTLPCFMRQFSWCILDQLVFKNAFLIVLRWRIRGREDRPYRFRRKARWMDLNFPSVFNIYACNVLYIRREIIFSTITCYSYILIKLPHTKSLLCPGLLDRPTVSIFLPSCELFCFVFQGLDTTVWQIMLYCDNQ